MPIRPGRTEYDMTVGALAKIIGKRGRPMARQRATNSDWDRREEDVAATTADPCAPLVARIEVLEEQVAMLEEGVPGAPGAQRAALAKEINEYREELDSRRRALRQCRGERG
jgi:hypothetical protein